MGMTIDGALEYLTDFSIYSPYQEAIDKVSTYIEQMQADYENRLKADLKAILVDLQLDVEGQKFEVHTDKDVWNDAIRVCSDIIQQKINELKGEVRGKYGSNNS